MKTFQIEIWSSETRSQIAKFEVKKTLTVGREGDISVSDERVSRRHLELAIDKQGNLTLKDLDSKNGVFMDGRKVLSAQVKVGSQIVIGAHRLVVRGAESVVKHDWPGQWQCLASKAKAGFRGYF